MKAVIYTRVSSDEQVKGTSLESQEALCREYCERRGLEVLEVFREEGESAKTADRTQLLRALEYCRAHRGQVQQFVVAKLDRFARNAEDHILVRKELSTCGVGLHSVSEPIGEGPSGRFIEMVLAASSEFDNAVRRQRCTDGMMAKLRQGIYPWKPPVGYRCARNRLQGQKKTEPDAPDPIAFPIIASTLKQYAAGEITSLAEFRDVLDLKGLADVRGHRTPKQTADAILGRYLPFYAGVVRNPWTGEEHQGLHEPMITRQEMSAIKAIRAGKRVSPLRRDRRNPLFPLRGIVLCVACLRPLTGSRSSGNGGRYAYYHCFNSACSRRGRTIPKTSLEEAFRRELQRIAVSERFFGLLRESLIDQCTELMGTHAANEAERLGRLDELMAKRGRILELREDGSYTPELFRERLAAIDQSIAELQTPLENEALPDKSEITALLKRSSEIMMAPDRHWQMLEPLARCRFQRMVFPAGIPYDQQSGFRTTVLGLPFELNRQLDHETSNEVHPKGRIQNILSSLQELISTLPEDQPALPAAA